MKLSAIAARCAIVLSGALLSVGCAGLVVDGTPDGGGGESSSSSGGRGGPPSSSGGTGGGSSGGVSSSSSSGVSGSSSGVSPPVIVDGGPPTPIGCPGPLPQICQSCSDGENVCAHYVFPNGKCEIQVCPPSPPPVVCAPGNACQPGVGCETQTSGGSNLCSYNCSCGPSGVFVCNTQCQDAGPPPDSCSQGALCFQGSGCGEGSPGGCTTSCFCDSTGHMQCTTSCPPPVFDAGCVEIGACIVGDHFDPTVCQCMPDQCVSSLGGSCGGFILNPCTCAAGLTCVSSGVPDVSGTCEPTPICDPILCPGNEKFDPRRCACAETCTTAADCTGPVPLLCQICSDGGLACEHWACNGGLCELAACP